VKPWQGGGEQEWGGVLGGGNSTSFVKLFVIMMDSSKLQR